MCRSWAARGIDAGLMTKPYHQARAPEGSFSGEYFISANLFWTIANFRQCVAEIRAVLRHMRPRYEAIGLFGMSSGGFQAGLAATCEPVDFHFPFITGCQLGSITWHGLITQYVRHDLERKGVTEDALNKVWSITDLEVAGPIQPGATRPPLHREIRQRRADTLSGALVGGLRTAVACRSRQLPLQRLLPPPLHRRRCGEVHRRTTCADGAKGVNLMCRSEEVKEDE